MEDLKFKNNPLKYWGAQTSYIEAIEIQDPPKNKHAIVLLLYANNQYIFWEIDDCQKAIEAADNLASTLSMYMNGLSHFKKDASFIREVHCENKIPWFLAKNKQILDGDFVAS